MYCKICLARVERGEISLSAAELKPFDEVESKASGGGRGPKLYHAECYDNYHLDFGETLINGEDDEDKDDDEDDEDEDDLDDENK